MIYIPAWACLTYTILNISPLNLLTFSVAYTSDNAFIPQVPQISYVDDVICDTNKILIYPLYGRSWLQTSLLVRFGGLEVLAALVFAHSTHNILGSIYNPSLGSVDMTYLIETRRSGLPNVSISNKGVRRRSFVRVFSASNEKERVRLIVVGR